MEALNAKERTVALLKFLGIFFVLVVLVGWGISYDNNIPFKQLDILKRQNASLNGSVNYQNKVLSNIDSLFYQLGRYDKATDKEVLNHIIGNEIGTLSGIASSDSITITGRIVGRANNIFDMYFSDKKQLSALSNTSTELTDKDKTIKDLSDKNDKLQDKIDKLQRDNDNLHDKLKNN